MPLATIISLISTFKDPLVNLCGDVKKEVEYFLDNGLPDYIESIESKFANTKTFLYRNDNVPFYDVFFPVSLRIGAEVKKVTSHDDLFGNSHFVSLIGTAGSGKTMLMKHFFLTSIQTSYKIPLFVELRNLNDFEKTFTEFIFEIIFNNRLSPDKKILERLLESGEFIFLLDGYDEIYSDKKNKITNDLDKFIDRYSKNNFIISSRPGSGIESLPRFNNYFVQELRDREVFEFIDLVLSDNDDKELGVKIKEVINKSAGSDYSNFLRSPLLLSMFILTFNTYPELPKQKSKFYWNVFDTLATKHDSFTKKGGYQHERKTGLQNEDFEKILQWFSYKSLFNGKFSFDSEYLAQTLNEIKKSLNYDFSVNELIEDLTVAISIIIVDGVEYKFPHKSLQEYFCAMLIKEQSQESKNKIYSEKFSTQSKASTGGLDNFWNLCLELDRINFLNYFIIPNLQEFKKLIYDVDPLVQLRNFYEAFQLSDHFYFDEKGSVSTTGSFSHLSIMAVYEAIISYLEIGALFDFTLSYTELIASDVLNYVRDHKNDLEMDDSENGGFYLNIKNHWNDWMISHLKGLGYDKMLSDIIKSIDRSIVEYNKTIKQDQKTTDLLLGL